MKIILSENRKIEGIMNSVSKKRRTRKQKTKPKNNPIQRGVSEIEKKKSSNTDYRYFRADLTKTLRLTMLALALELALWLYLSR